MELKKLFKTSFFYLLILLLIQYEPISIILISILSLSFSIFKPKYFINIFLLVGFIFSLNQDIFLIENLLPFKQILIFFSCLFHLSIHHKGKIYNKISRYVFLSILLIVLHSLIFSSLPLVSIFKWINFSLLAIVIFEFSKNYNSSKLIEIFSLHIKSIFILTLVFSFLYPINMFHFLGDAERITNLGFLFKGLFNHSLPFAQYLSISTLFLLITYKYQKSKKSLLFFIFLGIIFLILTKSRTSQFSFIFGVFLFFLFSKTITLKLIAISSLFILFSSSIIDILLIKDFNDESKSFFEVYNDARPQFQVIASNIKENFPFGIGFGIPSVIDANTQIIEIPFLNIPISVSSEKGNILLAMLEELGIIFFYLLFIFFLISKRLIKNHINFLILFLSIIVTNFGEYNFFSIGGNGFNILLFTILFVKDDFS